MDPPDPAPHPPSSPVEGDEVRRLRAEHAAAVSALHLAIRDTTRLTRLFSVLNESAPVEQLLDRVLSTLSELFMSDIVVLLGTAGGDNFVALSAIGMPAVMTQTRPIGGEQSYAAAALRTAAPVVISGAQTDPRVSPCLRELGAETAVWLPVTGDQTARGVLMLARCRALPFPRADVDLLATMAYRIGVMLDRAHAEQERRKLEIKLRQVEKTESLARMAGAIAHDFNNMLAVVIGSLDLVLQDLPPTHASRDDVLRAQEAANRAAETSGLMLAYLGQGTGTREPLDLAQVIREALRSLQPSLPEHIRLTTTLDCTEPFVVANAAQIAQALTNLVVNAREAIGPRPGEIRVALHPVGTHEIPASHLPAGEWRPKAATYLLLEVADTGCGMTPETVEKIFDPFFTTKFVGRGLGLPVVLGTVRAHDSVLSVQSSPGQGTTFRIFFPATTRAQRTGPAATARTAVAVEPRGLVLMADDEDIVRCTTQRILGKLGYDVLAAADGIEAASCFREHQRDIRIVILDLTMPRLDGWGALKAIRELRPHVPVILASGHDEAQALRDHPADPSLVFLHKPYAVDDLRLALEKASTAVSAPATPHKS